VLDIEEIEHLLDTDGPLLARREPLPVQKVLPHREMGKEPRFLENVAKTPSMLGHEYALAGVHQGAAIQDDQPLSGRTIPAMMFRSDVLPDPDGPKKAVSFPSDVKCASSANDPRRRTTSITSAI
jgi:hypothetical protein